EAMACGAPVIASHAGSLAEVVQDAGIKVDPMDSGAIVDGVHRLLDDAGFRQDLIARGHAQAAKFRWTDSGRQVRDLLLGLEG
ncbi:MAG TPA: glycosyltransferase, partial [Chloroflexota bacterium]|nr:glycosyltransferase [Chloroflexota bacterium]